MTGSRRSAAAGLVLALALLAGCGGGAPQQAQFVPPAPAMAELGDDLRVHYNLLPTGSLGEPAARRYGIERSSGTALLVVALRRVDADGVEHPADGQVRARARDLSGRHQPVDLRVVSTGDYDSHIGIVAASPRDVLRIELEVEADGRRHSFDFQRSL